MCDTELQAGSCVKIVYEGTLRPATVIGPVEQIVRAGRNKWKKIVGWKVALKSNSLHSTAKASELEPCP
jgi:hypothetical protein